MQNRPPPLVSPVDLAEHVVAVQDMSRSYKSLVPFAASPNDVRCVCVSVCVRVCMCVCVCARARLQAL